MPPDCCQNITCLGDGTTRNIPILLPLAAIPVANAFRFEKYWGMIAKEGTKIQPLPRPMQIP